MHYELALLVGGGLSITLFTMLCALAREGIKAYVKLYTDCSNTKAELWRLQNTVDIYQSDMEVLSKACAHIMNYKHTGAGECKCGERAEKALRDINYLD